MAYKIKTEVAYYNAAIEHGIQKHISSVELEHQVPADFKKKFAEKMDGQEPSYAAYKAAMLSAAINSWGSDGKFAVLSNDDGQDHLIINRDDIEYVKVSVVKTLDKE